MSSQLVDRIMSHVVKTEDGCWIYATQPSSRYAGTQVGPRMMVAHKAMYLELVGPIPDGLQLDHLCRRTKCVNPDHLEPVTPSENVRRASQREACPKGHPYTPDNLRVYGGRRQCVTCSRARCRANMRRRSGWTDEEIARFPALPIGMTRRAFKEALDDR